MKDLEKRLAAIETNYRIVACLAGTALVLAVVTFFVAYRIWHLL